MTSYQAGEAAGKCRDVDRVTQTTTQPLNWKEGCTTPAAVIPPCWAHILPWVRVTNSGKCSLCVLLWALAATVVRKLTVDEGGPPTFLGGRVDGARQLRVWLSCLGRDDHIGPVPRRLEGNLLANAPARACDEQGATRQLAARDKNTLA